MKKLGIITCALLAFLSCDSTKNVATTETVATSETVTTQEVAKPSAPAAAEKVGKPTPVLKTMLVGKETRESLTMEPFGTWFNKNYEAYTVKENLTPEIKKALKGVELTTFMGTWCGDSKRETPRMYKILDAADFKEKKTALITVNRKKKTPDGLTEGNDIIRVPTFIFKKDGKEIGRIVERPIESLESDMLKILNGEPYKHAYEN